MAKRLASQIRAARGTPGFRQFMASLKPGQSLPLVAGESVPPNPLSRRLEFGDAVVGLVVHAPLVEIRFEGILRSPDLAQTMAAARRLGGRQAPDLFIDYRYAAFRSASELFDAMLLAGPAPLSERRAHVYSDRADIETLQSILLGGEFERLMRAPAERSLVLNRLFVSERNARSWLATANPHHAGRSSP